MHMPNFAFSYQSSFFCDVLLFLYSKYSPTIVLKSLPIPPLCQMWFNPSSLGETMVVLDEVDYCMVIREMQ